MFVIYWEWKGYLKLSFEATMPVPYRQPSLKKERRKLWILRIILGIGVVSAVIFICMVIFGYYSSKAWRELNYLDRFMVTKKEVRYRLFFRALAKRAAQSA
jgi:uncharacterized membrane protein